MDFNTLLYHAQMNTTKKHHEVKYFKESINLPNKEKNKVCLLSDGIKTFFDKKEKEKYRLLMLKSREKKSLESVQSTLNDTKSAKKLVIEDNEVELVTFAKMAGDNQSNKDNNIFISKDDMDICSKVVDKYKNITYGSANDRNLFQSDSGDKAKVSLLKKESKHLLPSKRKAKHKAVENSDNHNNKDVGALKKNSIAEMNTNESKDKEKGVHNEEYKQILPQKQNIKLKAVEHSDNHHIMEQPLKKKSKPDFISNKPKDKEKGVLLKRKNKHLFPLKQEAKPKVFEDSNDYCNKDVEVQIKNSIAKINTNEPKVKEKGAHKEEYKQILPQKRKIKRKAVEHGDNHHFLEQPLEKKSKFDFVSNKPEDKEKGVLLKRKNKHLFPLKQEAKPKVFEDSNEYCNKDVEIQKKNSITKINTNKPKDKEKGAHKEEYKQILPQKKKIKPKVVKNGDYHHSMDIEPLQKESKTDTLTDKPKKILDQLTPLSYQKSLKISEKKQHTSLIIEESKLEKPLSLMDEYEKEIFLKEKKIEELITARLRLLSPSKCNISIYSPKEGNECLPKPQTTLIQETYEPQSKISAFERYVPKGNSSLSTVQYTPSPIVCSEENDNAGNLFEIMRMQEDFDEFMFRSIFLTLLNEKCRNSIADVEEELAVLKREIEMIEKQKKS